MITHSPAVHCSGYLSAIVRRRTEDQDRVLSAKSYGIDQRAGDGPSPDLGGDTDGDLVRVRLGVVQGRRYEAAGDGTNRRHGLEDATRAEAMSGYRFRACGRDTADLFDAEQVAHGPRFGGVVG